MESTTATTTTAKTPVKTPRKTRSSQTTDVRRASENVDPNVHVSTPIKKPISSPSAPGSRSAKSKKKTPKDPPPAEVNGRKFLIVRKNRKKGEDVGMCRQAAYEALRACHEDFFKNDVGSESKPQPLTQTVPVIQTQLPDRGKQLTPDMERCIPEEEEEEEEVEGVSGLEGSSKMKKMRRIVLEEARRSIPTAGTGQVKHLVKAFESLLSISKTTAGDRTEEKEEEKEKSILLSPSEEAMKNWPLPCIQFPALSKISSHRSSTEFSFPPKLSDKDFSSVFSSSDSGSLRWSLDSRLTTTTTTTSSKEGGSRRNSMERPPKRNKKLKVTTQNPFKLRTEHRGRLKEEEFQRKVSEMLNEEAKQRIPLAQRLPWTTDVPECLVKPEVKEASEPIDFVLHSDVRAMERAEFDQYMEKRTELAEQRKLEIERQRKLEEEEMIRRLRKDAVPKAQPMPYFDRPFVPRRSSRQITVPKEPAFHTNRPHSKCV